MNLSNFSAFALTRAEMKNIQGGDYSYCTSGWNAKCYQDVNDAADACRWDPSCKQVEAVWV